MKAITYTQYGPPEVLQLKEVEKPTPKENEVLVKIQATSVNASDWEFLTGKPLYARVMGLFKPSKHILGSDIAGRVEAVGAKAALFRPGDEVFGDIFNYMGGFAEYVAVPETLLLRKPADLTFEQVAALPQAAVIALQGIRDRGQVQAGQKVLINGAGGGAGTFAVQFAKLLGAEVTGVDSAIKLDLLRSIGADHVLDYRQTDFTQTRQHYDMILDLTAHRSFFDYKRALAPQGRYYLVGGSMSTLFQVIFLGLGMNLVGRKKLALMAVQANLKDLAFMTELAQTGKVVPIIDKCYPLSETAQALQYLGEGRALGKVVITL